MFRRFFKRKKQEQKSTQRDLFSELFPLTAENRKALDVKFDAVFRKMYDEEGLKALRGYSRNYPANEIQIGRLFFNDMGWDLSTRNNNRLEYESKEGDFMTVDIIQPNGKLERGASETDIYRSWMRNNAVQQGGGLILCEEFINQNKVEGYESIIKVPRQETTGMDYIYFLNIRNYDEQMLYQITLKIFEMSPTGMRDNISMHPISEITKTDIGELMGWYRQDPYQKDFHAGNVMNISEREEFDVYFPFHPLSIIRNEIAPSVKKSIRFK